MKKFVSLFLVMVMLLSLGTAQMFAGEPVKQSQEGIVSLEIQPRAQLVEVPDYYYTLTGYDGSWTRTAITYKEIRILDGYRLIQYPEEIKSIVYDGYYQNIKYASVLRWEYRYEIVPI